MSTLSQRQNSKINKQNAGNLTTRNFETTSIGSIYGQHGVGLSNTIINKGQQSKIMKTVNIDLNEAEAQGRKQSQPKNPRMNSLMIQAFSQASQMNEGDNGDVRISMVSANTHVEN